MTRANVHMKKPFGKIINFAFMAGAISGGFSEMAPEKLLHTNPDWIFCSIILVIMPLGAIGIVQYSISIWGRSTLRRPSWDRFTLNWWGDPLQCLFESTYGAAAGTIGNALRLPSTSAIGFWTFASSLAAFLGLVIGQVIVYRLHRARIVEAD